MNGKESLLDLFYKTLPSTRYSSRGGNLSRQKQSNIANTLLDFLENQQSENVTAVTTGVAHNTINDIIKKDRRSKSGLPLNEDNVNDFIRRNIKFIDNPQNTPKGKAITQLVLESGNPFIQQMDMQGFKDRGSFFSKQIPEDRIPPIERNALKTLNTGEINYQNFGYEKIGDKFYINFPRAMFTHRAPGNAPDTVMVSPGNFDDLIAELAHAKTFGEATVDERYKMRDRNKREFRLLGDSGRYRGTETVEGYTHNVVEPMLEKRFETLLDSLSAPVPVESLFR